jgi:hypothetical protein
MTALTKARIYWANGYPIPLDLQVELLSLGYDVGRLEARHRR